MVRGGLIRFSGNLNLVILETCVYNCCSDVTSSRFQNRVLFATGLGTVFGIDD